MMITENRRSQEYIEGRATYAGLQMYYSRFLGGSSLRRAVAQEFRMKLAVKNKRIVWN